MSKLHVLENSELNEYALNLLKKQKIIKIRQFFETDFRKLAKITNLSIKSIWQIKAKLRCLYGCQKYTIPTLENIRKQQQQLLQKTPKYTNIISLDNTLKAAGVTDHNFVVELCGAPRVGKSVCCHTIAINQALDNRFVLYIDTKLDFSPRLIEKMLNERNLQNKMEPIMSHILVEKAYSLKSVYYILKELEKTQGKTIQFVIIDSLAAIWYLKSERSVFKAYYRLKSIGQLIKKMNDLFGIKFVLVNLSLSLENRVKSSKPAMGNVWFRVPKLRIFLEESNNKLFFRIEKSQQQILQNKFTQVCLTNKGFY